MKEKLTKLTNTIVLRKDLLTALIVTMLFVLSAGAPSATTGIGK